MQTRRIVFATCAAAVLGAGCAEFIQRNEPTKLRLAGHNYAFRRQHHYADRLFNGFDYGHATISHVFITGMPMEEVEGPLYEYISRINDNPPRLAPAEEAITPYFSREHWRVQMVFDWTHGLHRQLNDILSDDSIKDKHAAIEDATDYYLKQPMALHWRWKRMDILMDGQPYSGEFRRRAPKWNGLIWAYHWLQNGIYEPQMLGRDAHERAVGVDAASAMFQCSRNSPPDLYPSHMPMSWQAAPTFAKAHPRAAAIFDNLHMLHDISSDVLLSDKVTDKRAELDRMVDILQDDHSFIDESGNRGMGPNGMKGMPMEKRPMMSGMEMGGGKKEAGGDHAAPGEAKPEQAKSEAKKSDGGMQHGGMDMGGEEKKGDMAMEGGGMEGMDMGMKMDPMMLRGGPSVTCGMGLVMNPPAYTAFEGKK